MNDSQFKVALAKSVAEYWQKQVKKDHYPASNSHHYAVNVALAEFIECFLRALDGKVEYEAVGVPLDELERRLSGHLRRPVSIAPPPARVPSAD